MPYLKEKQAFKDAPRASVAARPWHSTTGSALSCSHLKDLAQPMEDALAMDLPRSCFPSREASLSSFGADHEGEICFNLKASPSESELKFYSSPGSGDESQPWGNTIQKRNKSSSSVTPPFYSRHLAQVGPWTETKPSAGQTNPSSFPSHLWGDNREHFCFMGCKSAKLRTPRGFV